MDRRRTRADRLADVNRDESRGSAGARSAAPSLLPLLRPLRERRGAARRSHSALGAYSVRRAGSTPTH